VNAFISRQNSEAIEAKASVMMTVDVPCNGFPHFSGVIPPTRGKICSATSITELCEPVIKA
jgi:hypothetical protein